MESKLSNVCSNEYECMLFDLVPHLSEYKSISGGEGAAYFIDQNFVVKEYTKDFPSRDEKEFDRVFEDYCREIQGFAQEGYSVPKIYAWLKVPNTNKSAYYMGQEMQNKYYILEENIPGRWVYYFYEDLDEMYKACSSVCSKDDFMSAIGQTFGKFKLKREILKAYIRDYINVNTMLESMSDNELEKFVISTFRMAMWGKYSSPDLFRKNIILGDNRVTLIDNRFRNNMGISDESELEDLFVLAVIDLIEYNKFMDENLLLNSLDKSLYNEEIGKLILKNRQACLALTQKIFNILNKKMNIKPISNVYVYEDIEGMVRKTFREDSDKVLPMIQTTFEK